MKVKFSNGGKGETKNSKYIKKSKAHDFQCVNEKLKENSNQNYFKMEARKNSDFKFNFQVE